MFKKKISNRLAIISISILFKAAEQTIGELDCIYEMEYEANPNTANINNNTNNINTTIIPTDDVLITKKIPLEIALMIRVRNVDNCIQILDYLEQKHCFIIIMERFENSKDLFDYITDLSLENTIGLNEHIAREFFRYYRLAIEIF